MMESPEYSTLPAIYQAECSARDIYIILHTEQAAINILLY